MALPGLLLTLPFEEAALIADAARHRRSGVADARPPRRAPLGRVAPSWRRQDGRAVRRPRPFFDPIDNAFWELVKDRNVEKRIRAMKAHGDILQDYHARR
ncbi:hypothetical protein WME75_01245 [Sorangium sp. So ce1014]|uniref:hypothetical protein n=1 Tax=Sorangium sp. So ce1014 TaxID=3133326 RepID=UPI003F6066BF